MYRAVAFTGVNWYMVSHRHRNYRNSHEYVYEAPRCMYPPYVPRGVLHHGIPQFLWTSFWRARQRFPDSPELRGGNLNLFELPGVFNPEFGGE